MKCKFRRLSVRAALGLIIIVCVLLKAPLLAGALDDYVKKSDTNFSWAVLTNREFQGITVTELKLTSQQWRDSKWTHHMQVVRPEKGRNPQIPFWFTTEAEDGKTSTEIVKILADCAAP